MDVTIDKKLKDLWKLQQIDSRLDNLRAVLGELPMEVSDLEDDIAGFETRVSHISAEIDELNHEISGKKNSIKDFQRLIEKYDEQLNNIKNSREYNAIIKEKEIAGLEILSAEKRIREFERQIELKQEVLVNTQNAVSTRQDDLAFKKSELVEIEKENAEEIEKILLDRSGSETKLEPRLHRAYHRIRGNVRNGIAVASIMRGSCGGCFSKIPPQRYSDIRAHYRIIDCENCGRILVDKSVTGIAAVDEGKLEKTTRRKVRLTTK